MKTKNIIIGGLVLVLSVCILYIYNFPPSQDKSCPNKYKFLNYDLNCDEDPQDDTLSLKSSTEILMDNLLLLKEADRISIFYRNLGNRQWFGINENDNFAPGSLIKLPLAMAYYKLAEIDPNILNQRYEYKLGNNINDFQNTKPIEEIKLGETYAIEKYIQNMIQYSDNNPVPILVELIDKNFFTKVYVDLGINLPVAGMAEHDFVSVKTYGNILRQLYNASYLNQFYSNKLLEIMSKSSFKSGIVAGVPDNIEVANKFGERIIVGPATNETTMIELHDCGIVYKSSNSYILCIMAQGKDYSTLENVISSISKKIYENSK